MVVNVRELGSETPHLPNLGIAGATSIFKCIAERMYFTICIASSSFKSWRTTKRAVMPSATLSLRWKSSASKASWRLGVDSELPCLGSWLHRMHEVQQAGLELIDSTSHCTGMDIDGGHRNGLLTSLRPSRLHCAWSLMMLHRVDRAENHWN